MWKRLAILGGAIVIIAAIFVAVYYQQRHAIGEGYDIKCKQPSVPASASAELACKVQPSQNAEQGHSSWHWWYVLIAWPEGITAWLLMLTLGAIVWQAWETRKAAKAGAESANAAYGSLNFAEAQFELMKEERRARISIKAVGIQVQDPDSEFWNLATSIEIRNLGQTRAFVKRTGGEFVIRAYGEERSQEDSLNTLYLPEEYIDPSTDPVAVSLYPSSLLPTSLKVLADDLHDSRRMFHLYGFIEYETLGMKFTEEFKYFWSVGSFIGRMFSGEETNPTDAERVKEGHWWDNRPRPEDDERPPN
jgi:hypothetical protein